MARARLLKPGFFSNDRLAEVSAVGRLLFAGLWTIADREGRLEDRPKRIKAELLPYDDVDADAELDALAERDFIIRYEVNDLRLIQIAAFAKHQSPHPKEPPSLLPAMGEQVLSKRLSAVLPVSSPAVAVAGSSVAVAGSSVAVAGSSVAGTPAAEPAERTPRKAVDKEFLEDRQAKHPNVNVCEIYADAQNRKVWDGYKDKRRALDNYIGWAEEKLTERRNQNGNGNRLTSGRRSGAPDAEVHDRSAYGTDALRLRPNFVEG